MSDRALADLQASSIDSILQEQRSFQPPAEFSRRAHIQSPEEYAMLYKESIQDPEQFWGRIAGELHQPDGWVILRNEISDAFPVRQYQQLPSQIGLRLVASYRLRKPLPAIPRETKARHEREAADLPRRLMA